MTQINRRGAMGGAIASLAALAATTVHARANYPERPIRVIVPFAAGGIGDTAMRVLAPSMETRLGQKLVIESKPGAAGNIGTLEVARAEPDGHTILVTAAGNFVVNQFLMKMSFDPLTALTPIAKVAEIPIVFCSNPSIPARDLSAFVHYVRAHRGKVNYGSPGNGSVNHLLVENLKQLADIDMTHPYRGSPPGVLALLANEIQLFPIGFAVVAGHLREGKLTAIGVSTSERLHMLPEVPTVSEAGFSELAVSNWWAMAAPKNTPEEVIGLLNQAVIDALRGSTVAERLAALGMRVPTQTREKFAASLVAEAQVWSEVIRRGNVAVE
jgi:tripartite-type tricarboxylate transporter receptor subunit TctC